MLFSFALEYAVREVRKGRKEGRKEGRIGIDWKFQLMVCTNNVDVLGENINTIKIDRICSGA
jgi:hypothetical protein